MSRASVPPEQTVAAVDLGSNSFHLILARFTGGQLQIVDRLKERVQLAAGLDDNKHLDASSQERALACLNRFGELTKRMPPGHVVAVGTSTLRQLRDGTDFMQKAHEALGHEIEVISGHEEARLIYLGVAHTVQAQARRLVVDIGGGSTECVIGEDYEPLETDSLHMGCVNFSRRFFADGRVSNARMTEAENAAALELHSMKRRYRERGWQEAIGCSGTILALDAITRDNGYSSGGITLGALDHVRDDIIAAGNMKKLSLAGLRDERRDVLAGGLAILRSVFRALGIERMEASEAALREGALYELRGRIEHVDIRDLTVTEMMQRFHVDAAQAERVERTALDLYDQLEPGWIEDPSARQMLAWACRLHEIGVAISYSGNHHHAAYLVRHSDMDGFSIDAQAVLAAMLECHRRKLSREVFDELAPDRSRDALRSCMLLRLARKLNRARAGESVPDVKFAAHKKKLKLSVPAAWLDQNTVTAMDLEEGVTRMASVGYSLEILRT